MMNEPLNTFYNWLIKNHDEQKDKLKKYCSHKHYIWDDDIFQETIWLVSDNIIKKNGLSDMSDKGIENFFFISFRNNLCRKYAYNYLKKRDNNIYDNKLLALYEEHLNKAVPTEQKIWDDLKEDFYVMRCLEEIEKEFGNAVAHCYAEKYLHQMTYSDVIKKNPHIKDLKKKLLEAKQYIREKYTRETLKEEFEKFIEETNLQ